MEYKRTNTALVLRLDPGEDVGESILAAARAEGIRLASVSGIGAVDDVTVGIFDRSRKAYENFHYAGDHEITSLCGSVTTMNGEPYVHLHITCAGLDGRIVGGHLVSARISLTGEIFLALSEGQAERRRDENLGINRMVL